VRSDAFYLHNFLFKSVVRIPCEICCCLLHSFLVRFPNETSCLLQCHFHMRFCWTLRGFVCASRVVRWRGKWVQVRVRWETEGLVWKLSDSCHQHAWHQVDTCVFEGDVTWPEHALVMQGGRVWVDGVMYVVWRMFAFFGLFEYFWSGFFLKPFFSCTLTVNVIGLLFLRQCLHMLPSSTETSISGTSRKLPTWMAVSQYE
jgi:hypothetical protein